jgi:hypothetical protein
MTRTIGGALDLRAMQLMRFHSLERSQQCQAIHRLVASGMSEYGVSHATGLSIEQVRRILAEQAAP